MIKTCLQGILCVSLVMSISFGKDVKKVDMKQPTNAVESGSDIEIFTSDNSDGKITPK
ncbi:MAG TPA: DUF302 domain-containing protein, partial [Epsilonproteobacteria bacterium]|nr:DUF302 domain-containing protein [Campylobacterota bacterium]